MSFNELTKLVHIRIKKIQYHSQIIGHRKKIQEKHIKIYLSTDCWFIQYIPILFLFNNM